MHSFWVSDTESILQAISKTETRTSRIMSMSNWEPLEMNILLDRDFRKIHFNFLFAYACAVLQTLWLTGSSRPCLKGEGERRIQSICLFTILCRQLSPRLLGESIHLALLFASRNCKSPERCISFHTLTFLIFPTQLSSFCFSSLETRPGFRSLLFSLALLFSAELWLHALGPLALLLVLPTCWPHLFQWQNIHTDLPRVPFVS